MCSLKKVKEPCMVISDYIFIGEKNLMYHNNIQQQLGYLKKKHFVVNVIYDLFGEGSFKSFRKNVINQ